MKNINSYKTFRAISLGCRVNRAEIDDFSAHLISLGLCMTQNDDVDIVVVNTCTVTAVADKKTRKTIRKITNTRAKKIIVTGCAAALNKKFYESIDSRIKVVNKKYFLDFSYNGLAKYLVDKDFRTRASIKIQDGCNNECTYCIVHKARGKSISVSPDIVINRYKEFCQLDVGEVVLTGVNLGAYSYGLTELLNSLQGSARIRLSSIEPNNIDDNFIDYLKNSNVCKYLHLPLQSGSDRILKKMDRRYSIDEYLCLVDKLKKHIPSIALSTDIIVGFPGETDDDFTQSMDVSRKCGFMKIHVFPYSIRPSTPAALMDNQIPSAIKQKRAKILRKLSDELREKDLLSRKNTFELSLIENNQFARTESFHLVRAPRNSQIGSLVPILL